MLNLVLCFLAGLIVGALILHLRARARELELRERTVRLETERDHLQRSSEQQRETFKALAGDVLKDSVEQLGRINRTVLDKQQQVASGELDRQKEAVAGLVKPIGESLEKVNREILSLEKERARSHADLVRLMGTLDAAQNALRSETGNLVKALRRPEVKGRWGEMQLKKVVEMAGMIDHVDFVEQASTEGDAGRLRPDMIVRLPGGQQVVVDAKAPLDAYLEAVSAEDEDRRRELLADHARHIHDHMKKLGAKNYWREFAEAPEFVVMFLPGENIFGQALMQDPSLIEKGVDEKVIP
ncbi:DNA recombination protein RmuC, partial [bacterium]|nr:DNA recombination protein RmuC [bacterium]